MRMSYVVFRIAITVNFSGGVKTPAYSSRNEGGIEVARNDGGILKVNG